MDSIHQIKQYINGNETYLFSALKYGSLSYNTFTIPKKKLDEYRTIAEPSYELKKIQNKLKTILTRFYKEICDYNFVGSTGTISGTNILSNARIHINKKHVLNIDIKDFYSNISLEKVEHFLSLKEFGFNRKECLYLLNLLSYKKRLPQGAPTSPILANLVCISLDSELKFFAARNGLSYSRYVDDLTFSSNKFIQIEKLNELETIIGSYSLQLNTDKTRFTSSAFQQKVTGLNVNTKVNIDQKKYKLIRAIVSDIIKNGVENAYIKNQKGYSTIKSINTMQFLRKIQGYVNFIGQVIGKENPRYLLLTPVLALNGNQVNSIP